MTAPTAQFVLVVDDNLFLRPRIESSLTAAGFASRFVTSESQVEDALLQSPVAVLINAGSPRIGWETFATRAREALGGEAPIVAFGPHVDDTLGARAREAGCTECVPNGLVAKQAGRVVEQHLSRPKS